MSYSNLKYKRIGGGRIELLAPWQTPYGTIPNGTKTNGADVPWHFRWFLRPFGLLFEASVFHDDYYNLARKSKAYADKCFKLIALHFAKNRYKGKPVRHWIAKKKIHIAYLAVAKFGKGNY